MRDEGGHVWDMTRYGDTINERAVRILLECILVKACSQRRSKAGEHADGKRTDPKPMVNVT